MRIELPCLPLIQERFWNAIKDDLTKEDKKYYPDAEEVGLLLFDNKLGI